MTACPAADGLLLTVTVVVFGLGVIVPCEGLVNVPVPWKLWAIAGVGPATSAIARARVETRLGMDRLRVMTTS